MEKNISKQYLVIALLIINLIVLIVIGGKRMDDLADGVHQINNDVNNLNTQISNMEYGVRAQLESMREAELNYVNNFDYAYNKLNAENKTMFTSFTIELRESNDNSDVYLVVKASDGTVERTLLEKEKGLTYFGRLNLKLTRNYTFNVEEELNGHLRQLNYEPYKVWLKDEFYDSRVSVLSNSSGADKKSVYFNTQFDVNTMGVEEFEVEEIRLEVLLHGEVVYSEITGDGLFNMDELSQEELLKVAAGELIIDRPESFGNSSSSESATEEIKENRASEAHEIKGETNTVTSYVYQKVIVYDDLKNYELDSNAGMELYGHVVITFKDGSTFEVR